MGLIMSKISVRPRGIQREFQMRKALEVGMSTERGRDTKGGPTKRSGGLRLGTGMTVDRARRDTIRANIGEPECQSHLPFSLRD